MLAKVKTAAVVGLEGYMVDVEVDISSGLPAMTVVGLPDDCIGQVPAAIIDMNLADGINADSISVAFKWSNNRGHIQHTADTLS